MKPALFIALMCVFTGCVSKRQYNRDMRTINQNFEAHWAVIEVLAARSAGETLEEFRRNVKKSAEELLK